MNRCTVCGATSREGAKFCTSCGARLGDDNETATAAPEHTDAGTAAGTDAPDTAVQPVATADARDEPESGDDALTATTPSDNDHYASSWPGAESNGEKQEEEEPTDAVSGNAEPATTSVSDDETSWPSASASTSDSTPETITATPSSVDSGAPDTDDEDHHGASGWESWAPTASDPPPSSGNAIGESFVRLHQLLDEMQRRLERITNPATLASRNLDPDDLADQLEKWSRAVPDSDDLLEIVRQVRRSPKDIDALRQLSDRAADLELLVRHYQSITSTSDQWAADLRRNREDSADPQDGSAHADR